MTHLKCKRKDEKKRKEETKVKILDMYMYVSMYGMYANDCMYITMIVDYER